MAKPIKVGSYNAGQLTPVVVTKLFQSCDIILIQRFPLKYQDQFDDCYVVENWQGTGMFVKGAQGVVSHKLPNNNLKSNPAQGKNIPLFKIGELTMISCLPSFNVPSAGRPIIEQLEFIMDLVDGPTAIIGDMHQEDIHINHLYKKYRLINHIQEPTFTNRNGTKYSLDKILTTPDVNVSDIKIHSDMVNNNNEHYPFECSIQI